MKNNAFYSHDSKIVFENTADGQAAIVVTFSTTALECYISNYASRKLGETYFKKHIDNLNLHSKWMIVPRLVTSNAIPSDYKGMELLQKLIKARNSIVHSKAMNINLDKEELKNKTAKIRNSNQQIIEAALISFECIGLLGQALYERDAEEQFAKVFAGFLTGNITD